MELTRRIAAGALAAAVAAVAFFGFTGVAKADYIGVQVGQEKVLLAAGYYTEDDDTGLKISSSDESVLSCYLDDNKYGIHRFILKGNAPGSAKVSISYTDKYTGKESDTYTIKVSEQPINDCITLKAGQTAVLQNAPMYDDDDCRLDNETSTNAKVAVGSIEEDEYGLYPDVCVTAKGFGSTTVNFSWEEKDFSNKWTPVTYTVDVVVKDAVIAKRSCDFLFTGKTYTVAKLCDEAGLNISGGKFVKGSGYKVVSGGKKVTLTKTGAVNVKYKVGKTTHTIAVKAVHSYDALKKATIAKAKRDSWYPSTFRLISAKQNGVACEVKFSGENLFGKRVTQTVSGLYQFGTLILI